MTRVLALLLLMSSSVFAQQPVFQPTLPLTAILADAEKAVTDAQKAVTDTEAALAHIAPEAYKALTSAMAGRNAAIKVRDQIRARMQAESKPLAKPEASGTK